jgi:hypothetical protein
MIPWIHCQILVACFAVSLLAAGNKPNFTGTRKADVAKSTMTSTPRKNIDPDAPPGPPPPPPADMAFKMMPPETITHKEPELVIQSGPNTLRLTTDGKENTNNHRFGVHKSTTRWDGRKLLTKWKIEREGQVFMEGSDLRSLDRDGKTLIHDNTVRTPTIETLSHIIWLPTETERK